MESMVQEEGNSPKAKLTPSTQILGLVGGEQAKPLKDNLVGSSESNPSFGQWMVISRRQRKQTPVKKVMSEKEGGRKQDNEDSCQAVDKLQQGSRLNVLNPESVPIETEEAKETNIEKTHPQD